ncbi:hypothetical protein KCU92_g92, partial [Aureobasidium melanogenum]
MLPETRLPARVSCIASLSSSESAVWPIPGHDFGRDLYLIFGFGYLLLYICSWDIGLAVALFLPSTLSFPSFRPGCFLWRDPYPR